MKISILSPDLSSNCLGRAYLLAKILQRHYEIEIVGPVFEKKIWTPVAYDRTIKFKPVDFHGIFKPYFKITDLIKKIDGDLIYASKPLLASLGIGLIKKRLDNKPLILDIDDWELGFVGAMDKNLPFVKRLKAYVFSILFPYEAGSLLNCWVGERLISLSDEITVSNSFLQKKFGGEIIWHARDTKTFDPARFNKDTIREKFDIEKGKKIVMFFGSPRRYKGLEDLIRAASLMRDKNVVLIVVGIDSHSYSRELVRKGKEALGKRFVSFGLKPFEMVPEFLAMADIVAIPQKKMLATYGQMPAKVFDAMTMAKPVIATEVSDLPHILEGCGYIIEPGNIEQLAETIQYVLNHEQEAEEMGRRARKKCIEKYSWDAMEKVLMKIFKKYEEDKVG